MAACLAARTMPASRSMAAGSATEVPPNFMTIIKTPDGLRLVACGSGKGLPVSTLAFEFLPAPRAPSPESSSKQPLRLHELRVQHRSAGGTANCIVAERDELVREHR